MLLGGHQQRMQLGSGKIGSGAHMLRVGGGASGAETLGHGAALSSPLLCCVNLPPPPQHTHTHTTTTTPH